MNQRRATPPISTMADPEIKPGLEDADAGQADRKTAILHAAQVVFGRYGYSATTMKMVAEGAGVAFGLVAHYYGKKENLFLSAGFAMLEDLLAHLEQETEGAENGLEAVARYVGSYLDFTLNHRERFPILIRCSPFSDVELPTEREAIAGRFFAVIDTLRKLIERGVADGSIAPLPPERTAFLVFGNIVVAVRTLLITPYEVPNLYEETLAYVMRSLRPCERSWQRPCVFDNLGFID